MPVHVFGIRHHGPGCARSLLAALHSLEPEIVLVEGPPDAHDVLPLLLDQAMQPPVALLIYRPSEPHRASFYPFTLFSPEWQALRYAFERGVPARFIDLPQALRLADDDEHAEAPPAPQTPHPGADDVPGAASEPPADTQARQLRDDPIGMLAEAAGYADHELWWEHQIEQRLDSRDLFAGIAEAMTALRAGLAPPQGREALREAHMRQAIRAAEREGFVRIAVVCGAWHVPALIDGAAEDDDAELLRGLARADVAATWIPWTNGRLAYRSGYGAGVQSPGWYAHLWSTPEQTTIRWIARAAQLLRDEDLQASSSNVIEAVRLADALAALRDLPMPGLNELHESIQTVLCGGNTLPMRLIRDRLEIGDMLGQVPPATPSVPLQADLEAQQRRLRLKPSAEIKPLDLDLRNDTDLGRSRLLHRLMVLGVGWGKLEAVAGKRGTFHELWKLEWQPEFAVALIEASLWGNTLESAAGARLHEVAERAQELPQLTALLDTAILAALPTAIEHLLDRVRDQAAVASDVRRLMNALPPLARVARYGDIRATGAEQVVPVIDALFERAVVGLPGACAALDDDAAAEMVDSIGHAQAALDLLDRATWQAEWQAALRQLVANERIHGLVRGWSCRLLLDAEAIDGDELQRLARLALSTVTPRGESAAWIGGLLRGSAVLLMQHDGLWRALDDWLVELDPDSFTALLPLIRRAFADFEPPERRAMGEKIKRLHGGPAVSPDLARLVPLEQQRAELVLPVLGRILGVNMEPGDVSPRR